MSSKESPQRDSGFVKNAPKNLHMPCAVMAHPVEGFVLMDISSRMQKLPLSALQVRNGNLFPVKILIINHASQWRSMEISAVMFKQRNYNYVKYHNKEDKGKSSSYILCFIRIL
jgi:hypothetical protein